VRRLILRAHVWLVACLILLLVKVLSLRGLLRALTPPRWCRPYRRLPAEAVAEAVRRRLARPWHMKRRACLREGLMLFHFLCLAGRDPEVHFAVFPPASPPSPMHAHCWVTLDGAPWSSPPQGPSAEMMLYSRSLGTRLLQSR